MKEISGAKKERKDFENSKKYFIYYFSVIKGVMFTNRAYEISGLVSVLTGG
jgi:hypothetical protein